MQFEPETAQTIHTPRFELQGCPRSRDRYKRMTCGTKHQNVGMIIKVCKILLNLLKLDVNEVLTLDSYRAMMQCTIVTTSSTEWDAIFDSAASSKGY
jgi:hypothetical protein